MTDRSPPGLAIPSLRSSVGWFAIAQASSLVLSVVAAMALARMLGPRDYAVMATIVPMIGAVQIVQGLGLASAIVKAKSIEQHQLDSMFWLVMSVSVVLALLVALAGPPFARLLTGLELSDEYAFMALALLFSALASQPDAILARALRFREIALRNMFANATGIAVTIALAIIFRNHWALLVAPVLVPLINFLTAARLLRWNPGLPRMSAHLRPFLRFGLRVAATNLMTFISRNADNLIVASTSTPYQLGIYDRSYRVLIYPLTQAVGPLGQVLVPTLTRSVENPDLYRHQYWRVTGMLLLVALPGLAMIVAFPTTLIGALLGPTWLAGAPLFGWFAGAAMAEIVLAAFGWLLTSQGRGGEIVHTGMFNAVVALATFSLGIVWGIVGVAIAFTLGRVVLCLPYVFWRTGRQGPVDHRRLATGLAPHALALLATMAATWAVRTAYGSPHWPILLVTVCVAYIVYASVLFACGQARRWTLAGVRRRG